MRVSNSKLGRLFAVTLLILATAWVWYAYGRNQRFRDWVKATDVQRTRVVATLNQTPYGSKQQDTIRDYFESLATKVREIAAEKTSLERCERLISRMGTSEFCKKVFITKAQWQDIVRNCTRNGFFLCASEAKSYPDLVKSFQDLVDRSAGEKLAATEACKAVL